MHWGDLPLKEDDSENMVVFRFLRDVLTVGWVPQVQQAEADQGFQANFLVADAEALADQSATALALAEEKCYRGVRLRPRGKYSTETALSVTQDNLEGLEERVDGLEGEYDEFTMDELLTVCAEVEEVRSDWAWHKHTLSASPASTSTSDARCIDVSKPDTYDGTCNATIVDNFLFGLDQYFDAMGIRDEASKVGTTPIYL
ncbi:uncharacterized protein LOC18048069 [Citrus clementina]|uniref:uncharacterized protein LOC18048069 n=1 Tax=Citrus clementina TaxID=85681 RepID=UPI000CED6E91|nr:uncharacterized protein LOC18048069 [Citrus x clementina]